MGVNNSKKSNEQPIDSQKSVPTSPKGLINKLHGNLHKNRSSTSSSEKINSDSSGGGKKKLFKRRLNEDEEGSSPVSSSIEDSALSRCNSSAMTAAAEKASARYDPKIGSSYDPCIVPQHISSRLASCLEDSNDDDQLQLNKVQSNEPLVENLLKNDSPLQKDMIVPKWLNNYSSSPCEQDPYTSGQDIVSDFYLRQNNETDRRKQKDRQQRLHYLLKHIWKGIYRANLIEPQIIVDWCCGIGVWDMEMAALFPEAQVIGVDFKEAALSNLQHEFSNLKFRPVVIHNSSTGLETFESNSVDFVMMRDVWFINAPSSKWVNVLKESFRILKPGGWIEMSEHSLSVQSPGPCTIKVNSFFHQFFLEVGVEAAIAVKLSQLLTDTGFVDIDKRSKTVPLGEWAVTNELKQTGYLSRDWLERGQRNLSNWVCSVNHIDAIDINHLITKSMEEELDDYHSYMDWTSYIARKGPNSPHHSHIDTAALINHPPTPPTDDSSICNDSNPDEQ